MRELHAEVKAALRRFRELVDPPRAPRAQRRGRSPRQRGARRLSLSSEPIDPGVDIGHVHLKVADLDRALDFYCGVLGFELQQRYRRRGGLRLRRRLPPPHRPQHLALEGRLAAAAGHAPASSTSRSATRPGARSPTRCGACAEAGVPLGGASDHGVSEALYLTTPTATGSSSTGTGREEEWPSPGPGEKVAMYTRPLDLGGLLAELDAQ